MAGSLAIVPEKQPEKSSTAITEQLEIHFSRFFNYPPITSTYLNLAPLNHIVRNRWPLGTWISSSSTAFLQLIPDSSIFDVILSVRFRGKIIEEHYISKLHFSWPQVSCISGFPARGTRTVIVSYRDSVSEIRKFALRFSTIYETESFVNTLKETMKDVGNVKSISSDLGSQISSQSELISSNGPSYRASEEVSIIPVDNYTPQLPSSSNNKVEPQSCTQKSKPSQKLEGNIAALPPSFTSLLSSCSSEVQQDAAQQSPISEDIDLKSQIAKYMEDSCFLDMLNKVEKVMNELGGHVSL